MSLIRQIRLLVVSLVLLACLGGLGLSIWSARAYLQNQLAIKNQDAATAIALLLAQQDGSRSFQERQISANFDTGYYRSIVLKSIDGSVLVERSAGDPEPGAPAWFVAVVRIDSPTGRSQISVGWRPIGSVEVESHPSFAYADLWAGALKISGWMFVLGLLGLWVGHRAVELIRAPLDQLALQADRLVKSRFSSALSPVPLPSAIELRRAVQAINYMVAQVRRMFAEQADQMEDLRRATFSDPLTGVSHRQHFLGEAEATLSQAEGSTVTGMLLMRVNRLADLNMLAGRARTDALLREIGAMLSQPLESFEDSTLHVGRLNNTDFALLVSSPELAELAAAWLAKARLLLVTAPAVTVTVSGAAWRAGMTLGALVEAADLALARAEALGSKSAEIDFGTTQTGPDLGGEAAWRRQLVSATVHSELTRIDGQPVTDRLGKLLHHECRLSIRLSDNGPFEPPAIWLPMALRTQLLTRLDELAVGKTLREISRDGQPRAVSISLVSLRSPEFVMRLLQEIRLAPPKALSLLWIEIDENALVSHSTIIAELYRQLRAHKVCVGLEHAGERLQSIGVMKDCGLDYVKLSADFTEGVSHDTAKAAMVRSAIGLLHAQELLVIAERVTQATDIPVLWEAGIDGIGGPATATNGVRR